MKSPTTYTVRHEWDGFGERVWVVRREQGTDSEVVEECQTRGEARRIVEANERADAIAVEYGSPAR